MTIAAISPVIISAIVQLTNFLFAWFGCVSGMNHAIVHMKIVTEVRNFIGLIHGLMPMMVRVSPIDSSDTTMNTTIIAAPVQNSSGSR